MPIKLPHFDSLSQFEDRLKSKLATGVSDLEKVEARIEPALKEAKDDLFDGAALALGYAELAGLGYPK